MILLRSEDVGALHVWIQMHSAGVMDSEHLQAGIKWGLIMEMNGMRHIGRLNIIRDRNHITSSGR